MLVHAPQRLHDELSADYTDMIYAASAAGVEQRRRAFIRKWRPKCKVVNDSLKEAMDRHSPSPGCRLPMEERAHRRRHRTAQ